MLLLLLQGMPEEAIYAKRLALRFLRSRLNERAMAQIAALNCKTRWMA